MILLILVTLIILIFEILKTFKNILHSDTIIPKFAFSSIYRLYAYILKSIMELFIAPLIVFVIFQYNQLRRCNNSILFKRFQ